MKLAVVSLAMVLGSVHAQQFFEAESGNGPQHLTPVDSRRDDYSDRLAKHLLLVPGDCGSMMERPSFTGESWIGIHSEVSKDAADKHGGQWMVPADEKKYSLTLLEASESLWYTMADHNDDKKTKDVTIKRHDRVVSLDLAVALQRALAAALLQTRYPLKSSSGLDGTTYEFGVWVRGLGYLRGQTWSPDVDILRRLVDIGQELRGLATDKAASEKAVIAKLRTIERECSKD